MIDGTFFAATLGAVLVGWLLLLVGAVMARPGGAEGAGAARRLIEVGGLWVPAAVSLGHAVLLGLSLGAGSGEQGSLFSLAGIVAKFADPDRLFLLYAEAMAFSLFVGGWIARDAAARSAPRPLVVPVLLILSLLGPAGLVAWLALRRLWPRRPEAI